MRWRHWLQQTGESCYVCFGYFPRSREQAEFTLLAVSLNREQQTHQYLNTGFTVSRESCHPFQDSLENINWKCAAVQRISDIASFRTRTSHPKSL